MSKKRRRMAGISAARQESVGATTLTPSRSSSGLRISPAALDGWDGALRPVPMTLAETKEIYGPALTLGAPEEVRMACDSQLEQTGVYSLLQHSFALGQMPQTQFLGYGVLQQIAQNGMIRACVETTADDMTRNWIELRREGEAKVGEKTDSQKLLESLGVNDDQADTEAADMLTAIDAEMARLKLRQTFHDAAALVGYMGGCLVFVDTGETDPQRLREPLHIGPASIELQKDRPLRFIPIDPVNVFPGLYNSLSPLREDYFKPRSWWVLGQEVHSTRLLRLVANELPVLLKPAYNFLGQAQAQILWDYVMHFQNVRVASQRLLGKFSLTVMKTDMQNVLTQQAGTAELDKRIALLVQHRSNDGVQVIDKEAEDIVKLETPISGVTDVVRQSLEILAAMNRTPAVKLLGISPSGFNATGESDIRNYYDHILSQQEKVLRPALQTVLKILQIKLFSSIDESITFDFSALSEADNAAIATTQKTKADTMAVLLDRQVISPEEARRALADDPDSGFADIDVDEAPEPQEGPEDMGGMPQPKLDDVDKAGAVYDANGNFKEGDHPRDNNGQFTSGSGGEGSKSYSGHESTLLESNEPDTALYEQFEKENEGNVKATAKAFFEKKLKGKYVDAPAGNGETIQPTFTGNTWRELKRDLNTDPLKGPLFPYMPDIMATGEHKRNKLHKQRDDGTTAFHEYTKTVPTKEGPKEAIVDVAERPNKTPKHTVYNMSREGTENYARRKAMEGQGEDKKNGSVPVPSGPFPIMRNETVSVEENISPMFEVVNLRWADEPRGY